MNVFISIMLIIYCAQLCSCRIYALNENWVCNIKTSCVDCLKLSHCTWCGTENKCFSKKLTEFDYCQDNATDYNDYGLSIEDNAVCGCSSEALENRCRPPGEDEGPECSGRGVCQCGRCVCDSNPDPEFPTKMIVGEYCEYDNFSCSRARCNHEGPYHFKEDSEDA